jgi:hypothetical protein
MRRTHTSPEDRHKRPLMTGLYAATAHPVCAQNLIDPTLPLGAQLQMILKQLAKQLAGIDLKTHLKL